jgi:phage-related protein
MVAERQSHDEHLVEGRAAAQQEMDAQVQANAEQQAEQRRGAGADVVRERGRWTAEQETAVGTGRSEADTEHTRATTQVESERRTADREAAGRIEQGNTEAATARTNAERNARAERDRGKNESRGVLGWLADRARGFFDALKRGLQAIFNAARAVVRRAIEAAQRLASGIIDAARRRIVGLIRAVGTALIAIADRVLAAFPALRDRFRAAIRRVVDAAVAAVNRLADALKEGIRRALSALGSLIEGALGLLERAYMAAIDVVAGAVRSVIRAAQAIVQLIGEFAALIRDVAADPMGWLRNLGASIVDGLRNHVWRVLKCKVKEWFNSKVEEVLGLGRMIFQLLRSGGIRFAEIGRMVWDALKAALPGIAIQLAIEKLVSLLVPAASAIMLIIDGLKAAWGAISRIIAAIEAFFTFLRAVKTGNAGRQFAEALAGGAVALIDFLSNFLVGKLKGPASGVGGRLSGIAARLGRVGGAVARGARSVGRVVRRVAPGLARVAGRVGGVVVAGARVIGRGARAVGRGVVTGVRAVGRGVRAVGRGIVTGVRAVGRGVFAGARAVGRVIASGARAVGRGIASAARSAGRRIAGAARSAIAALARRFPRVAAALRRARAAWDRARTRFREWRERRRQRRRETNEQRLERATNALRPQIGGLLRNRVWAMRLRLQLAAWRLWYRLRRLSLARTAGGHSIVIGNSPDRVLIDRVVQAAEPNLHRTLVELSEAIINEPEVIEAAEDIMDQRMIGRGKTPLDPIVIPPSPGGAAASRDIRNIAIFGQAGVRARGRAAGGPWSAGRIGRSEVRPEQEWLALAPQYGFAASDVYLGRRGKFHPGSLVVIGPQSYASLRRVTPARPGVIESAAFALQGGRMPPGLTVPEQYYAAGIGRVSQVEAGRFSAGLAQERMLGHLAATGAIPAELRHGALSPASMASAGSAARAVDIRSGIVHQGGPGDLSPEGTLGALPSAGVRHDLARAYLDRERRLVVEFVYREIQLENAMSDDPAALMAWMRDKFRARLREVMMAERAGSTSVSSGLP